MFAGTVLNQTGQAVEVILITMGVYLALSLATVACHELVQRAHRACRAVRRLMDRLSKLRQDVTRIVDVRGASYGDAVAWMRANLFSSWGNGLLTARRGLAAWQ